MTSVALAAGGAPWERSALAQLERARHLVLARRCVDVAELLALAHTGAVQIALVDPMLPGMDLDAVHQLRTLQVRLVAVTEQPSLAAARGLTETVAPEGLAELDRAAPAQTPAVAEPDGLVLAVWGPAGAPGRSAVALSVAAEFAARGVATVLVDADVHGGSQAQQLALLDEVSGLVAACRAANQGHLDHLDEHVLQVEDDLAVLTGLPRADMWPHVRPGALEVVIDHLRSTHRLVVVDCSADLEFDGSARGRHAATETVLSHADYVVAVGLADPVGLARLVRGLSDLGAAAGAAAPTLVVNRFRPSLGWSTDQVDQTLHRLAGLVPSVYLPADVPGMDKALLAGRTPRQVSPGSPFVAGVAGLVTLLTDRAAVVASPRPE